MNVTTRLCFDRDARAHNVYEIFLKTYVRFSDRSYFLGIEAKTGIYSVRTNE